MKIKPGMMLSNGKSNANQENKDHQTATLPSFTLNEYNDLLKLEKELENLISQDDLPIENIDSQLSKSIAAMQKVALPYSQMSKYAEIIDEWSIQKSVSIKDR